jgi:hypothetical protein
MSNSLISSVFVGFRSNSMLLETHVGPDLRQRNCGGQVSHAHQIVGGAGQRKDPVHSADPTMPHLPHERDRLQPAEAFFDPFPPLLADGVTRVPRGAAINRATSASPPGSAPRAASPADSGTLPQTRRCRTLCRRPLSADVCREASPSSPAPHRVPPFRWLGRPPRLRSVRSGSPPTDSSCNSTWTASLRFCAPAESGDRSWTHGFRSSASPRESSLGVARIIRRSRRLALLGVENLSDSPRLPAGCRPP